jgi:DinB superfamily
MDRIEIEHTLNESRNESLAHYGALTEEERRELLTRSEHDPNNHWSALDHLAHLALIETNFQQMIRKQQAGTANPVGLLKDDEGNTRTRDDIAAIVHALTESFQRTHHNDSFVEVVALTGSARAKTLALLSELTDERLRETLQGAPWGDGTIGGVLAANAHHARSHWQWVDDARKAKHSS